MSWTPQRVIQLKRLRAKGYSASQIAKQLGGVTRNAVLGKLFRLEVAPPPAPDVPKAPKAAQKPRTAPTRLYPVTRQPLGALRVVEADSAPVSLTQAGSKHCLYPLGEPDANMLVCGAARTGGSYCAAHAGLAFRAQQPKLNTYIPGFGKVYI